MKFVFILFSLLVFCATSSAEILDSLRSEQRGEGLFVIHQVEEEETLYSIARRYGGTVEQIIADNNIIDNSIDIGQKIEVLVIKKTSNPANIVFVDSEGIHVVKKGETLYSLSKMYDVKIRELKDWNNLKGNELSLGMPLKVTENAEVNEVVENIDRVDSTSLDSTELDSVDVNEVVDPFEGYERYLVQAGETLHSIANKIGVGMDSLRNWNGLNSDYLKIGQQLYFQEPAEAKDVALVELKEGKRKRIDEDGFERTYEEGIASVIESMNTNRFLALHRSLPIGTNIEVRNLMNNQVVHVKVVGKLPKTGLNKDLLLRISKSAYNQLGILDSKARVEVSYYE